MSRYVVSPEAVLDLVQIERRGRELFGEAQADRFQERFEEMFSLLAERPGIGHFVERLAGRDLRFIRVES
jgi:plasmid stabilization system protein ParE